MNELKNYIESHLISKKSGRLIPKAGQEKWMKKNHPNFLSCLLEETSIFGSRLTLSEKLWCVIKNISTCGVCLVCGNHTKFCGTRHTFNIYCSMKCKNSNERKFGSNNNFVIHKEKIQKIIKDKYGVENISQLNEIKEKKSKTLFENFGVAAASPGQISEIREKIEKTNQLRYGFSVATKNIEIIDKIKKTTKKKYGVDNWNQKHIPTKIINLREDTERYRKILVYLHHKRKYTLEKISTILGLAEHTIQKDFQKLEISIKRYYQSSHEKELIRFLSTLSPNIKSRIRIDQKEFDIFLPDISLAIEFAGLYWHSFVPGSEKESLQKKNRAIKTEIAEKQGIKLFRVYENEWLCPIKQNIWKSKIALEFGICSRRFRARKLKVQKIDSDEARSFFDLSHLQGFAAAKHYYALTTEDNKVVACMGFSKRRFSNSDDWELVRFAVLPHTSVIGGASKLLKHFEREHKPKKLVSFADRRLSTGKLYKTLGFELVKKVPISYDYVFRNRLISRYKMQKKNMKKFLPSYNPQFTETDNARNAGFRRIWNCGHLSFYKYF